MNFIQRGCRKPAAIAGAVLAAMILAETAAAKNYDTMSISDVLASAELAMQRGGYQDAIPALQEVINRTASLTDDQGRQTAQACRYELARVYYQIGDYAAGMALLDDYLNNEPRPMEKTAIRMLAGREAAIQVGGTDGFRLEIGSRGEPGDDGRIGLDLNLYRPRTLNNDGNVVIIQDTVVATSIDVRDGEATVVGASKLDGDDRALITILRTRVGGGR